MFDVSQNRKFFKGIKQPNSHKQVKNSLKI